LDLIFNLEEEFNIEIPKEDELRFVTVQDVITYVQEKTKAKQVSLDGPAPR
jgi:acyl carrier protein